MNIHITQTTKQFLPEKVYKTIERGIMDIAGKASIKTFLIVGKYNKFGNVETLPYTEADENKNKDKVTKLNSNGKVFACVKYFSESFSCIFGLKNWIFNYII